MWTDSNIQNKPINELYARRLSKLAIKLKSGDYDIPYTQWARSANKREVIPLEDSVRAMQKAYDSPSAHRARKRWYVWNDRHITIDVAAKILRITKEEAMELRIPSERREEGKCYCLSDLLEIAYYGKYDPEQRP